MGSERGPGPPPVSVVMSVYDDETHLAEAIESVLAQDRPDFEFLIADDGSTDGSPDVVRSYAERDARIRWFRQDRNRGLARTLNVLLRRARGRWIARMDADDVMRSDRLRTQLRAVADGGYDLVWCNVTFVDAGGREICDGYMPPPERVVDELGERNFIPHPGVVFRRDTVLELGGYDESRGAGQDHELWTRMRDHGCRFGYVDRRLMKVRVRGDSVTRTRPGYADDMAFNKALLCLRHRRRRRSLPYIRRVRNPIRQGYLLARMAVGEDAVDALRRWVLPSPDGIP